MNQKERDRHRQKESDTERQRNRESESEKEWREMEGSQTDVRFVHILARYEGPA